MQKGESIGVMSICQMVGRHESDHPSDQIQSVQYLPEHATRLHTQMSTASNVEELFINSTKLDRNRGYELVTIAASEETVNRLPVPKMVKMSRRKMVSNSLLTGSCLVVVLTPHLVFFNHRGRSPAKGNNSGRPRSTTPVSNPGQG